MEKIIFFSLVIPILAFVLYLGGTAIMNGFSAKSYNKSKENESKDEAIDNSNDVENNFNNLSDEINKLNELLKNEVITREEFEKAKKKILEN